MSIFKCKMCGGTIEFEPGATVGVCDFCGAKQTLPRTNDVVDPKIERARMLIESSEWEKADELLEMALSTDPHNAEAYFEKLLVDYKSNVPSGLARFCNQLTTNINYKNFLRFSNEELIQIINHRIKNEKNTNANPCDDTYNSAMIAVAEFGYGSTSGLQRKLHISYSQAVNLMDMLEKEGVIGSFDYSNPHKALITVEEAMDIVRDTDGHLCEKISNKIINDFKAYHSLE